MMMLSLHSHGLFWSALYGFHGTLYYVNLSKSAAKELVIPKCIYFVFFFNYILIVKLFILKSHSIG